MSNHNKPYYTTTLKALGKRFYPKKVANHNLKSSARQTIHKQIKQELREYKE